MARRPKLPLYPGSKPDEWWSEEREIHFLRLARANPGKSWVYFLESLGWVKVGHSKNMPKRLSEIRLANAAEVRLIGLMTGEKNQEQAYRSPVS
jgi:hypothetical protein